MSFVVNIKKLKTLKHYTFWKKHQFFFLFAASLTVNIKKIFKKEKSTEILKIIGLINNVEQ